MNVIPPAVVTKALPLDQLAGTSILWIHVIEFKRSNQEVLIYKYYYFPEDYFHRDEQLELRFGEINKLAQIVKTAKPMGQHKQRTMPL